VGIPKSSNRSGGPKSTEGKLAASRNSLKTGAYSSITVLPGEDLAEYAALEEQLHLDFQPSDLAEAELVREIASLIWKKLRLERLEYSALAKVLSTPLSDYELLHAYRGPMRDNAKWLVDQIDKANPAWEDQVKCMNAEATQIKALDRQHIEIDALNKDFPYFLKHARELMAQYDVTDLQETLRNGYLTDAGKKFLFIDLVVRSLAAEASVIHWAYENRNAIQAGCRAVKEERLMSFMTSSSVRRAHDDLSRAFYKALSELRKHQEWRSKRAIDVTPEPQEPGAK
jgi:hypothetical protein